jgi:hypothetical protein
MIALGHIHYKKYIVWVSQPLLSPTKGYQQEAGNLPYYEVLLTKKENLCNIYVDIVFNPDFKFLMNLDDRNQPIKDVTDLVQYQAYLDRKGSSQLLYKLSNANVAALLDKCQELSV